MVWASDIWKGNQEMKLRLKVCQITKKLWLPSSSSLTALAKRKQWGGSGGRGSTCSRVSQGHFSGPELTDTGKNPYSRNNDIDELRNINSYRGFSLEFRANLIMTCLSEITWPGKYCFLVLFLKTLAHVPPHIVERISKHLRGFLWWL